MATCTICGTIHGGWSCPTCSIKEDFEKQQEDLSDSITESSEEQQSIMRESLEKQEEMFERQREAIEEAQEKTEYALQEASERHRETVSEAWKLQANTKANRAYELYEAEMYDEAIKLSLDAISQDPGNIRGYRLAGWSFKEIGQNTKARDMLKKQISLLRTNQYIGSPDDALKVLKDIFRIKDCKDLTVDFLNISKNFNFFPDKLISELLERSSYDTARNLYSIHEKDDNIEILTYGIEINNRILNKTDTIKLEKYLQQLTDVERNKLLREYEEIKNKKIFSANVIEILQKKIEERYKEWLPDIEGGFLVKASLKTSAIKTYQIGWGLGIFILYVSWINFGHYFALIIAIIVILLVNLTIRVIIRNKTKNKLIASMRKTEQELLERVGIQR